MIRRRRGARKSKVGKSHQFLAVARSTTDPADETAVSLESYGMACYGIVWCGRSDGREGMAGIYGRYGGKKDLVGTQCIHGRYGGVVCCCPLDHRPLLMRQHGFAW